MDNRIVRFLLYLCLGFTFHVDSTCSSPVIFYAPFERIVDQLAADATLPSCTFSTCERTSTQANFSRVNITDDTLFKLSLYSTTSGKPRSSSGPLLIASTGIYRGKRIKYRQRRYIDQFLGIYYAEVPQLLAKPVKKSFHYALQNATRFTPYCMQSLSMTENLSYGSFIMQHHFDENCLSLNIYRADLRYGERRKAIMIFSHGGSNQIGGGSLFDGSVLASEGDIIVVTMNFRLNYHGFLSSGDQRVKGNYGLWDQLLAIEWIYENAHLFGGDPKRITLAGHSAGAGNAMLIPASHHCRGMIKRVISQSGTGLAPWSVNRQPMKLIERLSREFHCQRPNEAEMFRCIYRLLADNNGDFYRLHVSLSIADDNPYPVIDHDFLNDTIENVIQSDVYRNIDLLTGVTLNEGLYFAEYHIGHFYGDLNVQSSSIGKRPTGKQKRSVPRSPIRIIAPDIIITQNDRNDESADEDDGDGDDGKHDEDTGSAGRTHVEQILSYDPKVVLAQFSRIDYVERYIKANFKHGQCFLDEIRERYEYSGKGNVTIRLKLYIDLVSDLMFNYHMVRSLNLRARVANQTASNYVYIYSHRPTFKARSLFRDHLKLLPQMIGHFAELDYVFGIPLARGYHRIHRNVNMTYYNYSEDEEDFSRQLIRYWSNFIKTGNPNNDSLPTTVAAAARFEWAPYTTDHHNYIVFELNNIHAEPDYYDSMYSFWLRTFQTESNGRCYGKYLVGKMKKHLVLFFLILFGLLVIALICFLCKLHQKKMRYRNSPEAHQYPNFVTT